MDRRGVNEGRDDDGYCGGPGWEMAVPSGRYLRARLRRGVHHHFSAVRARGSSADWWRRGLAEVSRREDDGLVGDPWPLGPHGLSLRALRAVALPRVEGGQQKGEAGGH